MAVSVRTIPKGGVTRRVPIRESSRIQTVLVKKEIFPTVTEQKNKLRKLNLKTNKVDKGKTVNRFRQESPKNLNIVGSKEITKGVIAVFGVPK